MQTLQEFQALNSLYLDTLARPIDLDGFKTYAKYLQKGKTLEQIKSQLAISIEAKEFASRKKRYADIDLKVKEKLASFDHKNIPQGELFHVVISRYNENVDWIHKLALFNCKIWLYNKGPSILEKFNDNVVVRQLENIAYEDYVYVNHIIDNYTILPNRIIFMQCGLDHCPNILEKLCNIYTWSCMIPLANNMGKTGIVSQSSIKEIETEYGIICMIEDKNLNDIGGGKPYLDYIRKSFNIPNTITLYDYFVSYFDLCAIKPAYFIPGAIFYVPGRNIKQVSLTSYVQMKKLIEDFHNLQQNGILTKLLGSIFERLWVTIFNQ